MKCKLCGKKGVQLAHWRTAHKDYMRRKASSPEARAKGARTRARHKAEEVKSGERLPRKGKVHRGRKREVHVTEQALESGDVTIIIRRA